MLDAVEDRWRARDAVSLDDRGHDISKIAVFELAVYKRKVIGEHAVEKYPADARLHHLKVALSPVLGIDADIDA